MQFVTMTDRVKLDSSARTQVRTQVMLEFHRRKRDRKNGQGATSDVSSERVVGSGVGQTSKLKFGPEGLQTWKPRKRKKDVVIEGQALLKSTRSGTGKTVVAGSSRASIAPNKQYSRSRDRSHETLALKSSGIQDELDTNTIEDVEEVVGRGGSTPQWLRKLDVSFGAIALGPTPNAGAMDPFNVVSLLINPRTQVLLYYYCELVSYNCLSD
jgi:hypothetical protein